MEISPATFLSISGEMPSIPQLFHSQTVLWLSSSFTVLTSCPIQFPPALVGRRRSPSEEGVNVHCPSV